MPFQPKDSSQDGHKRGRQSNSERSQGLQPRQMSRRMGRSMNRFEPSVESKASDNSSLDETVQAKMENAFQEDFSDVQLTKDSDQATKMGAQAFAQGNKIHFAPGNYKPHTTEGQELIGHELAHVVQQKQGRVKATTQAKGAPVNDDPALENEADMLGKKAARGEQAVVQKKSKSGEVQRQSQDDLDKRLDEIEAKYRSMIADARSLGHDVAADNLQRFLAGTGGTKTLGTAWLRGFSAITDAEEVNQSRFEDQLYDKALSLRSGESERLSDYWEKLLTGSVTTELFYASGTSTIKSSGSFNLSRDGNEVEISGNVNHHWFDPYDWHAGLSAYIPGSGVISDADALLLQQHRGAGPFDMESDWQQALSAKINIDNFLYFDSMDYNWTGP